jgi:uncharacterized SAM-dependent methyltransferase
MLLHPFKHVRCHGLIGTFDDARSWLQSTQNIDRPKCLVSLGSSIGNLTEPEATYFLNGFRQTLCRRKDSVTELQSSNTGPFSTMLIGLDSCKSEKRVRAAYNDPDGLNAKFLLNALEHVNKLLGYEAFCTQEWVVQGEWIDGCYKQCLVPLRDVDFEGTCLAAGTKVHMVQSQKYGAQDKTRLWGSAGFRELHNWRYEEDAYGKSWYFISGFAMPIRPKKLTCFAGDDSMISMLAVDSGDA